MISSHVTRCLSKLHTSSNSVLTSVSFALLAASINSVPSNIVRARHAHGRSRLIHPKASSFRRRRIDNTVISPRRKEGDGSIRAITERDSITGRSIPRVYRGAPIPAINSSMCLVAMRLPAKRSLVCQPVSKRSRIVVPWQARRSQLVR